MQNQDNILLVKNIPSDWGTKDLLEIFGPESGILDVKVFGKEHYGFITFKDTPTLRKWVGKKQLLMKEVLLDLSKGEKNNSLYIQIKNPSFSVDRLNSVLEKNSVMYFDISPLRKEIIIKFYLRAVAELAKKFLEDCFNDNICVSYADRESLPIAIHLSFNKDQASKDIHIFNKIELEKSFNGLLQKKGEGSSDIDFDVDIDLPYEKHEYKGYGTLVFTPTFKGISECERILRTQQSVAVNGVLVRVSRHEYKKKFTSFTSCSSASSSFSSFTSSPISLFSSFSSSSLSYMASSYTSSYNPSLTLSQLKEHNQSEINDDGDRKKKERKKERENGDLLINNENEEGDDVLISSSSNLNNGIPNSTSLSPPPSMLLNVSTLRNLKISREHPPLFVPKLKINGKDGDKSENDKNEREKKKGLCQLFFPEESVVFNKEMRNIILGI